VHDNEEGIEVSKHEQKEGEEEHSLSPILSTRYAYRAAKIVRIIEKNFLVIIGIAAACTFFAIIDILQETAYVRLFPSDDLADIIIAVLAAVSLAALVYAFWMLARSRSMLNNWAKVFEQNSIRSGISIAMTDKSKREAVKAIAEVVEEVAEPLGQYIESKGNLHEFFDAVPDNNNKNESRPPQQKEKISFDVLIDEDRVQRTEMANDSTANDLKEVLKKYGSIIVKIVDGTIDKKSVQSFSESLSDYIAISKKKKVGLALMIGDDIAQDANRLARNYSHLSKKDHNIILIEKSERILSDYDNLPVSTQK
jgi:hypothetical protein